MHLLLCSASDFPGLWAFQSLRERELPSLELLSSEMLAYCSHWDHRVGVDGVHTSFRLPDGRTVDNSQIDGVWNRLLLPPQDLINQAVTADREYAQQETTAFYLSWLNGLSCPVINRPTPQGLAGRWRHATEWALAAHEAGFSVPRYEQTENHPDNRGYASFAPEGAAVTRVISFDGEVFGPQIPLSVRHSCLQLSEIAETRMLGIDLFPTVEDQWSFGTATPLPDLQIGGFPLLTHIARALSN